jgi:HTH-type transcriptional regulator/antitoxin HigA
MHAEIAIIQNDADLTEAQALVARLGPSDDPADVARLRAQALILAAYEAERWPCEPVSVAEMVQYIMDQHGLSPADLAPVLGARSRVTEVLNGRRGLSLAMIRRMRATFHVSADVLIGEPRLVDCKAT